MQTTQKIEFYKERSFSEKLNATIEFIRQNIKNLAKMVLYFFGPIAIVYGVLFGYFMLNTQQMANNMAATQDPLPFMTSFGSYFSLFMILGVLVYGIYLGMIYNYIKLYNEKEGEISLNEVWSRAWPDVPKILLFTLVGGFLIMLGFLLFIIGAIYFGVVLSLGVAIMVYEKQGVFEALSRCFQLIKEKWFSTLGLLFVILILQYAVQALFSIPYYVISFGEIFLSFQKTPEEMMMSDPSTGYMVGFILSFALTMFGSFCAYMLPQIAISYQYANLVERQESKGLMQKIENLDTSGSNSGKE